MRDNLAHRLFRPTVYLDYVDCFLHFLRDVLSKCRACINSTIAPNPVRNASRSLPASNDLPASTLICVSTKLRTADTCYCGWLSR